MNIFSFRKTLIASLSLAALLAFGADKKTVGPSVQSEIYDWLGDADVKPETEGSLKVAFKDLKSSPDFFVRMSKLIRVVGHERNLWVGRESDSDFPAAGPYVSVTATKKELAVLLPKLLKVGDVATISASDLPGDSDPERELDWIRREYFGKVQISEVPLRTYLEVNRNLINEYSQKLSNYISHEYIWKKKIVGQVRDAVVAALLFPKINLGFGSLFSERQGYRTDDILNVALGNPVEDFQLGVLQYAALGDPAGLPYVPADENEIYVYFTDRPSGDKTLQYYSLMYKKANPLQYVRIMTTLDEKTAPHFAPGYTYRKIDGWPDSFPMYQLYKDDQPVQ